MSRAHRPKDVVVKRVLNRRSWTLPAWIPFLLAFVLGVSVGFAVAPRGGDKSFLEEQCLTPTTLVFPLTISARAEPTILAYAFVYRNQTAQDVEATSAEFDDLNTTAVNEAVPPLSALVTRLHVDRHVSDRQYHCMTVFLQGVTP